MRGYGGFRIALGAVCSLLVAASPAFAAPQVDGVFSVTGLGIDNQITQGPDGNIWVTVDDGAGNDVARITPAGEVTKFNLDDVDVPVGITSRGNGLWVTAVGEVARFSPGSTNATPHPIPEIGSTPRHITLGPDRNLWTVSENNVIKIPPAAPDTFTSFPGLITSARQIVAGADDTLWATGGTQVINFTTAGTHVAGSPYNVGGGPQGIAAGPGTQIAYGNPIDPETIGRITPPGPPELTSLGNMEAGFGMTFGDDGAYWFGQFNSNDLGRLTPEGEYTTLGGFPAAPNRGPRQITTGPDNTLWVTLDVPGDVNNDAVARVAGVVAEEPPPDDGPPDNDFQFGKVKKNKKKGTATQTVIVPGPGAVQLARSKKVKGDEESTAVGGEVKLKVKPRGKADRRLEQDGKAKVGLEVTYTPSGGDPNTKGKKLKLVQRG
jgi:streptogramin lyase